MEIEWLKKKGESKLIVFYNGWGMNSNVVSSMDSEGFDILHFYDYRSLDNFRLDDISEYQEVWIIAWSMGVWAATATLNNIDIPNLKGRIAINGTERPVDDLYGIPVRNYILTERGMDEKGLEKFYTRIFGAESISAAKQFKSNRPIADIKEELHCIRENCRSLFNMKVIWTKAYIGDADVIFPTENQKRWWNMHTKLIDIPSVHYPFFYFKSWNSIING